MGVADKRKLGQQTDAALRRGERSCFAQIAPEANASRNASSRGEGQASASTPRGPTRPTILGEHRKDLVKSIRRTQTVTRGNQEIPRAHQDEGPRERQAEGLGWSVGWLGARSACDETWRRCGRASGFVVRSRTRCSGETMVGAHSRESRPSQGEGQAGASTPCGPTREGEARQRGRCGAWSCQQPSTPLEHCEGLTAPEQDEVSDRSHREGQVAGSLQCR